MGISAVSKMIFHVMQILTVRRKNIMWSVGAYLVVFVIPVALTGVSIVLYTAEKHKKGGIR